MRCKFAFVLWLILANITQSPIVPAAYASEYMAYRKAIKFLKDKTLNTVAFTCPRTIVFEMRYV